MIVPGDGDVRLCTQETSSSAEAGQAGTVVAATSVGDGETVIAPGMVVAVVATRTRRLRRRRQRRFLLVVALVLAVGRLQVTVTI